jgi:multiple sugar transport system substrate-binding protein
MGRNSTRSGRSESEDREAISRLSAESWISSALTRRDVLRYSGYASAAAFLAACGGSSPSGSGASAATTATGGQLTVGSNASDPTPKAGLEQIDTAFTAANGGSVVKVNTVDHGTFQDQISSYLQATPEDVFTWFSGHRMRFFASKGLATPIDDVWDKVKGNFSSAFAVSVKGNDGHVYGIPTDYYPWGLFYRKSLFQERGYKVPTTWDELKTLCTQMQKDGPDTRVTNVFNKWAEITGYYNDALAGMTWQQAAQLLVQKKAGMYMIGLFVAQQFLPAGQDALSDLDFFAFPQLGTKFDAENALDAPIDVLMVSKRSPTLSKDRGQVNAYLEFWSKGSTQLITAKAQGLGVIPAANDTDTSSYTPLTNKAVQLIKDAKRITQFFDRDSRPDFAGPNGMQSFLLSFLQNPKGDIKGLQGKMQSFWDSLPPEA